MLRELIPGDLVKIQSANDWKRSIIAAYNQDAGKIIHTFSQELSIPSLLLIIFLYLLRNES